VDTLEGLARTHPPVLVQGHAGRSCSAVVVAAWLMRSLGLGADKAVAYVAARRHIAVAKELERLLDEME
jgi:protein-tyrosine phosphatase